MTKHLNLIAFLTVAFGFAHAVRADTNITESPEGIQEVAPPSNILSPTFINDGNTSNNWQSRFKTTINTFEFTYDDLLDGNTGEDGDANDIYRLTSLSIYLPGTAESLKEFILEVQNNGGSWQNIFSPQAVTNPYNFAQTATGGFRAVDPSSYASSSARINDGVIGDGDANWISTTKGNTFEFTFDPDLNGTPAEVSDQFTLDSVTINSPGSSRSLKEFQLLAQSNGGAWQRLYSSQAPANPYNFAQTSAGGIRAVDPPSYASTSARINNGVIEGGDGGWLSTTKDRTFEFIFDPDLNGVAGQVNDQFTLDSISIYSRGDSRDLKDFEIKVKTTAGWQPTIALQANKMNGKQTFVIGPYNNVIRVRFRTITNYGNTFLQINEFKINGVWNTNANPTFIASETSAKQQFDLSSLAINNDGRRENITRLKFKTISNYGQTFLQINEFQANGIWGGNNPIFRTTKVTGSQNFDLSSPAINNDGRRDDITRLRFKTLTNYGASYLRVNEFQAFGVLTGNLPEEFNAFDSSTVALATKGPLQTRVADNSAISFDVIALTADKLAVDTAFTHDVKVELLGNMTSVATDADKCPVSSIVLATLAATTITNGRSTVTMPVASNVWKKVYVRISYQPPAAALVVACAVDQFAIRPAQFTLVAQHADWETSGNSQQINVATANASPIHKAGRPFSLQLKAVDSAGTIMTNYIDIPSIATGYPALVAPASGLLGNLNLGTLNNSNGVIDSNTAHYSEVGAISLQMNDEDFAGIDASDGTTLTNRTISSPLINIGRFVPDHFEATTVTHGSFDDSCTGFTYSGQLFTYQSTPELKITAYNSSSAITQNYTGSFAKLTQSDFSVNTPASDAVRLQANNIDLVGLNWNPAASSLSDNNNGSLNFTFGADSYNHLHDANSLIAPYTNTVNLSFTAITDSDGVTTQALPHILQPTGGSVRFGRIAVSNAHGSELTPLPVTIKMEYFNGIDWVDNTGDRCTTLILASQIQLSNPETGGGSWVAGNTTMTIANGTTTGTLTNNNPLANGSAILSLSAPGEDNQGYVDIKSQISGSYNWLLGDYDNDGVYDDEASARASFGLFKGSDTIIFRREIY